MLQQVLRSPYDESIHAMKDTCTMVLSMRGLIVSIICLVVIKQRVLADVTVDRSDRGYVVNMDGKLFTEYLAKAGTSPALWPIVGPTGKHMTRAYPFREKESPGTDDHPHHQSLWFTHDDVSTPQAGRADFWKGNRNDAQPGIGPHVIQRKVVKAESDGKVATIVTENDWMKDDKKMFEDERTVRFGQRQNGDRWIDFTITIKATEDDVTFGDNKEGTFAVRVPDTMAVDAERGGKIVNDQGVRNRAAWGIPASWVDYTGPIEGETLGIAIFSHPKSFRPNTRWHVRTYGLFAANPFAQEDFPKKELSNQGAYTIKKGDSITLRYRVLFHRGRTDEADIPAAYSEFESEQI